MPVSLLKSNDRKEQLSLAYVASIAAAGGFTISIPNLDKDSIDILVSSGTSRRASVQFQLKATSSPDWDGDDLKFQLKSKNYNDLVVKRQVPLLLAVMVLPEDPTEWLTATAGQLVMKRCIWWQSLIGRAPTDQGSSQVRLPGANLLTVGALTTLISRSEENTL